MNKSFLFLVLILLASCFSRSALMTRESYDDIQIGTSIQDVAAKIGKPYAIHNKANGEQEYEYIERVSTGNELAYENHYFLIVRGGVIVGKRETQEKAPAFDLIYQDDPNYMSY